MQTRNFDMLLRLKLVGFRHPAPQCGGMCTNPLDSQGSKRGFGYVSCGVFFVRLVVAPGCTAAEHGYGAPVWRMTFPKFGSITADLTALGPDFVGRIQLTILRPVFLSVDFNT